mgnify:CR=1 FL=1
MAQLKMANRTSPIPNDPDPAETGEWLDSLYYVLENKNPERVKQLLSALEGAAHRNGVVEIVCHRSEMGQGIRTSLPQVIADELEADWDRIELIQALGD